MERCLGGARVDTPHVNGAIGCAARDDAAKVNALAAGLSARRYDAHAALRHLLEREPSRVVSQPMGGPMSRGKEKYGWSVSIMSLSKSATSKRLWLSTGALFDFKLRSKSDSMAFIDLGDQFLALQKGRTQVR